MDKWKGVLMRDEFNPNFSERVGLGVLPTSPFLNLSTVGSLAAHGGSYEIN